ncbi:MAG: DNA-formamidopyrimidine glycosylase family protein [Candidatus Eremiobacterota bacterium]
MPELPDVEVYIEALRARILGAVLEEIRLDSPFLLRTVDPAPRELEGRQVAVAFRLGKRVVIELEEERFLVLHLMIAGRLRWRQPGERGPALKPLASFRFSTGVLHLTEAGTRKRASLALVRGRSRLAEYDPAGLEVLQADLESFTAALKQGNHTLKRILTDPHVFSGIGNAYSDEILHRARLSPIALNSRLTPDEIARLYAATRATLLDWLQILRAEVGDSFPEKVTAFRPQMAVHGRYGQPCPECGTPVQRIVYAENETNYCPTCQTGGRLLADRSLSRLLKKDWPRTLEELEQRRRSP